jgi:hypothetical protein
MKVVMVKKVETFIFGQRKGLDQKFLGKTDFYLNGFAAL